MWEGRRGGEYSDLKEKHGLTSPPPAKSRATLETVWAIARGSGDTRGVVALKVIAIVIIQQLLGQPGWSPGFSKV